MDDEMLKALTEKSVIELAQFHGGPMDNREQYVRVSDSVVAIPVVEDGESVWYPYVRKDDSLDFHWDGRILSMLEVVLEYQGDELERDLNNWNEKEERIS